MKKEWRFVRKMRQNLMSFGLRYPCQFQYSYKYVCNVCTDGSTHCDLTTPRQKFLKTVNRFRIGVKNMYYQKSLRRPMRRSSNTDRGWLYVAPSPALSHPSPCRKEMKMGRRSSRFAMHEMSSSRSSFLLPRSKYIIKFIADKPRSVSLFPFEIFDSCLLSLAGGNDLRTKNTLSSSFGWLIPLSKVRHFCLRDVAI